jgi:hypothetical protein
VCRPHPLGTNFFSLIRRNAATHFSGAMFIVVFSTKVLPTERFQTQIEGNSLFFRVLDRTK